MGSVERAVKKMQQNIGDPKPTAKFLDSLKAAGLELKELESLKPEDQFKKIMEAIAGVSHPTQRAGIALQLFGRAGTELLPMLEGGATGFNKLINKASELGLVMDEHAIRSAEKFKDSMETLSSKTQAALANSGLIDWLADVADRMDQMVSAGQKLANMDKNGGKTTGAYASGGFRATEFAADYLTLGYASQIADATDSSGKALIETSASDADFAEYQKQRQAALAAKASASQPTSVDKTAEEVLKTRQELVNRLPKIEV
jgi:hypothetical protein